METGLHDKFKLLHSGLRPSCLQATIASLVSQESSHTVPHCPWKHTSTRPSKLLLPSISRMSVLLQAATAEHIETRLDLIYIYSIFWHMCSYVTQLYLADRSLLHLYCDNSCGHQLHCAVHIIQEDLSSPRAKDAIVVCMSDCYCICKLCNIHTFCCCMTTKNTIKVWHVLFY